MSPNLQVDERGVAWITFDDPERKVNVLSEQVLTRFGEHLAEVRNLASRAEVRVVVLCSAKSGFIAGADVTAIEAIEDPVEGAEGSRFGQGVFGSLNHVGVPSVAAIHGICLGGGVEMSLACSHRIASDSPTTKFGLPEVLLGILPAWGGTTRLPRLIGVQASLDLMLSGRQVSSSAARRMGLVDEVVPAGLFREKVAAFATAAAKSSRKQGARRSLLKRLMDGTRPGRRVVLSIAKKRVMTQTGGHYPAPLKILEVVGRSANKSLAKALEIEAKAAGELVTSPVCKNLIHVFQLREEARKGTGVDDGAVEPGRVEYLAVLGAGVMGGGIAQLAAYRGIHVRMKDIHHDAVASGLQHARKLFTGLVKRRKLRRLEADQRMTLISGSLGYEGFSRQNLVVEAVVEKMDIKRIVLRETEDAVRRGCILATNTSSLSVNEMASALARPESFVGMHFFNPVHRMPLVEVVRGARSSDHAVATTYALALTLMNEAGFLLADGASVEAVDAAAKKFGMPMGPLRLVDEVGIDISRHAGQSLHEALGNRLSPSPPLVALAESGRLGKKGGIGFYRYESGKEKGPDPEIYAVLSRAVPPVRVTFPEREIRGRLVLAMVNEAARALEAGIVQRARDVDLAMIMGTGFPPFRGGLLRFADTIHTRTIVSRRNEFAERHGARFAPAEIIRRLARENHGFYESFPG
jgi:3-hydroxyacyl-CoA dehydrogenase/enoyl-CoA hydratase/3-hydroxybutyryl-CoA epimerase